MLDDEALMDDLGDMGSEPAAGEKAAEPELPEAPKQEANAEQELASIMK